MKKIKYLIIILLSIFSFYYTEKIILTIKNKDPLMTMINDKNKQIKTLPVNGIISKDTIIVGKSGKEVNTIESYEKMKTVNQYNETLIEYKKIKPNITKDNNYNKAITGVLTESKELSIIFFLDDIKYLDQIYNIFKNKNAYTTIFIDSKLIETDIPNIDNISFGLYGYNDKFNKQSIDYTKKLYSNTNYEEYCLYKDEKFLTACTNEKINTIKSEIISKDIYSFFKNNKEKGKIYQIKLNSFNIRQLEPSINYLIEKGYKIKKLSDLLEE